MKLKLITPLGTFTTKEAVTTTEECEGLKTLAEVIASGRLRTFQLSCEEGLINLPEKVLEQTIAVVID